VAAIAPRSVLIEWGGNDEVSNTYGMEQAYQSALKVYRLLGQPDRIGIMRVPGFHGANDQEACLDWLDIQFGRSTRTWSNNLLFPWDFEKWRANSKETGFPKVDLSRLPKQDIHKSIEWMLGEEPARMPTPAGRGGRGGPAAPQVAAPGGRSVTSPGQVVPDLVSWVIQRGGNSFGWLEPQRNQTVSRGINFGYNVRGDLYYPANTAPDAKLPVVIWLHGYSYSLGYMWGYHNDLHPILALVEAGYAVLAYDQSGFGSRMGETAAFYDRYPHWSQMGRMVEDARAALDALEKDSLVDPVRMYVFGYSIGGTVGLYTAALDPRVEGLVSISGFTPMRTDTADRGTGGVARYSHERGLIPRLGFFVGHEDRIPYDFDDLIAGMAPRPAMIVEPQLDRDGNPADVHGAIERARRAYVLKGASASLVLSEPWDYTRLPNSTQDEIIRWMRANFR
jgi:pimeloyl-ACP methyl ester carboxylesterase